MWRYSYNLRSIYETPSLVGEGSVDAATREKVADKLQEIRKSGRYLLTEYEAAEVFSMYGIPTMKMRQAHTEEEAAKMSEEVGFPVVLKLNSRTITHKTDVGGVQLNLKNAEAVKAAFKTIKDSVTAKVGRATFRRRQHRPDDVQQRRLRTDSGQQH